ncbi:MAG: hypothetical protein D6696_01065 [Acidobacteria bacterium]|nr:MAG: hypothetical protein D6696_01065 [Acidobacteriota bacterium]
MPGAPRTWDGPGPNAAPAAGEPRFVAAAAGHRLRLRWSDAAGLPRSQEVRLRGTVLVDAGRPWLHVLLQHLPEGGVGRAVLVSEERVTRRYGAGGPT